MGKIAWALTLLGIGHILSGLEHLLFVLALLFRVPLRDPLRRSTHHPQHQCYADGRLHRNGCQHPRAMARSRYRSTATTEPSYVSAT